MEDDYKSLYNNISAEYEAFKAKMFKNSKEEIYLNCGKIHFYTCIYDYFNENEQISEKHLNTLASYQFPICSLWKIYLKYDSLKYDNWNDIEEILDVMYYKKQ